jgi:hypothetical protein
MTRTIAALYVDARGPYVGRDGVDAWTIDRDARLYDGPDPVVAHPPCADWSTLTCRATPPANYTLRPERRACGPRAVEQVRRFGGVLEHPAYSKLWHEMDMPRPGEFADEHGGWTLYCEQVAWGHPAKKGTWLYIVGIPNLDVTPMTGGTPTHVVTTSRRTTAPSLPEMKKSQRHITPPAFAEFLIGIARRASP